MCTLYGELMVVVIIMAGAAGFVSGALFMAWMTREVIHG